MADAMKSGKGILKCWLTLVIGFTALFSTSHAGALEGRMRSADSSGITFILDELPENLENLNIGRDGEAIVSQLRHGNPKLREIALTFDDGPHPMFTAKILSILRHYRVPATFYLVGVQAERYPDWVKMIFQEGHEIGNHTYDHFRLVNLPYEEQVYQIEQFQALIFELTGVYPKFLRPPGGRFDKATVDLMNRNGLALGLWTINPKDPIAVSPDELFRNISRSAENGSIILLHDGSESTVQMLPKLIETLKRKGYTFVTMSQMLMHSSPTFNSDETRGSKEEEEKLSKQGRWKVYTY